MTKVLLITPPVPYLAFPNAAPHVGMGYLISYLRENGIEVDYMSLEAKDPDDVKIPEGYDYYGLTSVTSQYFFAKLILDDIKKRKLGKTILGGAQASIMPDECLSDGFDYVVKGYGEIALLDIVQGKHKPGIIQGTLVDDLDSLPFPAWKDLLQGEFSFSYGSKVGHVFSMRGCPFNCFYCCSPTIYSTKVRYRSIDNVISELNYLKENFGIENAYFFDATLTLFRERALELAEKIAPLNLDWTGQTRVDKIDLDLLEILKESGCNQISFGIETGAATVHQNLGKQTTLDENRIAIKMAHDAGMKVKAFLMGALPDETKESAKMFKQFISENKPDSWLYSTFIPFPGTAYWNNPEKFGIEILCKDYRTYYPLGLNARGPVNVQSKHMSRDELVEFRNDMLEFLRKEVPNGRVEEAINNFPKQKEILMKFYSDLDTKYIF